MRLEDFRRQYPQYSDISDEDLAKGLHRRFYSDIPFEDFSQRVGLITAESGDVFVPALKYGFSGVQEAGYALAGRTGLMDEAAAQKAIEEEQAYQQRVFKPTEEGFLEAPVTKTLELLGQSLPFMVLPVAAAGATLALPVTGAAATVAGLGAAGLASGAQFTGTNLLRQMEPTDEAPKGKSIGETDLGDAALAAVPQAALDVLSLRMMPFIRGVFGQVGKDLSEEAARRIASKNLKDVAADYALATGKTMTVEGLTEAAQQSLERLQAGLTMTDEAARDEYLESFIGGAVLGGVLAPPGRYLERRAAQKEVPPETKPEPTATQPTAPTPITDEDELTPEEEADLQARIAAAPPAAGLPVAATPTQPLAPSAAVQQVTASPEAVALPGTQQLTPQAAPELEVLTAQLARIQQARMDPTLSPDDPAFLEFDQQEAAIQARIQQLTAPPAAVTQPPAQPLAPPVAPVVEPEVIPEDALVEAPVVTPPQIQGPRFGLSSVLDSPAQPLAPEITPPAAPVITPIIAQTPASLPQAPKGAADNFLDAVVTQFGMDRGEAQKALDTLVQEELIELDPNSGQFRMKDGRFWDPDVMRKAAAMQTTAPPLQLPQPLAPPVAPVVEPKVIPEEAMVEAPVVTPPATPTITAPPPSAPAVQAAGPVGDLFGTTGIREQPTRAPRAVAAEPSPIEQMAEDARAAEEMGSPQQVLDDLIKELGRGVGKRRIETPDATTILTEETWDGDTTIKRFEFDAIVSLASKTDTPKGAKYSILIKDTPTESITFAFQPMGLKPLDRRVDMKYVLSKTTLDTEAPPLEDNITERMRQLGVADFEDASKKVQESYGVSKPVADAYVRAVRKQAEAIAKSSYGKATENEFQDAYDEAEKLRKRMEGISKRKAPKEEKPSIRKTREVAEGTVVERIELPDNIEIRIVKLKNGYSVYQYDLDADQIVMGQQRQFRSPAFKNDQDAYQAAEAFASDMFDKVVPKMAGEMQAAMKERLSRGEDVINNKTPDPDIPADQRLVLMACCATKKKGMGMGPAIEVYTGVFFQTLKNKLKEGAMPNLRILSAKYGFIAPDQKIEVYDQVMDKSSADGFMLDDKLVEGFPSNIKDVLIVGSDQYQRVMKAAIEDLIKAGKIDKGASINVTKGGIGEQRAQLGRYLASLPVKKEPEGKRAAKTPLAFYQQMIPDAGFKRLDLDDPRTYKNKSGEEFLTFERDGVRVAVKSNTQLYAADRGVGMYMGKDNDLLIQAMIVDESARRQGKATKALQDILSMADQAGMTSYIEPVQMTKDVGMTTAQLKDFYKRFGFKPQKTEPATDRVMVREPGAKIEAVKKEEKPKAEEFVRGTEEQLKEIKEFAKRYGGSEVAYYDPDKDIGMVLAFGKFDGDPKYIPYIKGVLAGRRLT
jgi:GNAT superfamily N-acetyltransferase